MMRREPGRDRLGAELRTRILATAAAVALGLASACVTPAASGPSSEPTSTASWRSQPLSWEKLEALEDYLDSAAAGEDPASRVEAELELAEGRLTFAERERTHVPSQRTALRLAHSQAGFERVLSDRFASKAQRARAQRGVAAVGAARGAVPASGGSLAGGFVPRSAWGAAPADPRRLTRHRGAWTRITVHHSADANDVPGIQRFHMTQNDWGDVGYHFLIDSQGRVFEGRSMAWQGAHAGSSNNPGNVGVCVLGDYSQGRPSAAALAALDGLVKQMTRMHGIPDTRVLAHRDLKATDCPGPYLAGWAHAFRGGVAASTTTASSPRAHPVRHRSTGSVR